MNKKIPAFDKYAIEFSVCTSSGMCVYYCCCFPQVECIPTDTHPDLLKRESRCEPSTQHSLDFRAQPVFSANGISGCSTHIDSYTRTAEDDFLLLEGYYRSFVVKCDNHVTLTPWATNAGEV